MQMSCADKQGANLSRHMEWCGEGGPSAHALSAEWLLFSLIEWLISCFDSITRLKVHQYTEPEEMEGAGQPGNTAGNLASGYRQRERSKRKEYNLWHYIKAANNIMLRITIPNKWHPCKIAEKTADIYRWHNRTMLHGFKRWLCFLFLLEYG